MYTVYLINFQYVAYTCDSREEAIANARNTGFECAIYGPDNEIIHYSPISGIKIL